MKKFTFKAVADILMLTHIAWIILLIGGTIYIFFNPAYIQWHLTIITLTLLANLFLGYCPITNIEEKLRKSIDPSFSYNDSFAATLIKKIFGIKMSSNDVLLMMTLIKFLSYSVSIIIALTR